jgi:hypothetical protein
MKSVQTPIVVKNSECGHCAVHTKRVHHREFPEIWAEAGTTSESAAHLSHHLEKAREGSRSAWHLEGIERALKDLAAFIADLKEQSINDAICRCDPKGPSPSTAKPPKLAHK